MKKFLSILSVVTLLLSACNEKGLDGGSSVKAINIETDVVYTSAGEASTLRFSVSPATAKFNSKIGTRDCEIRLEITQTNANSFDNYKLESVKMVDYDKGIYKATILDLDKFKGYDDEVILVIKNDSETIKSEPFRITYTGTELTNISIKKEQNKTAVLKSIDLTITENNIEICSPLISKPELVLSFETNGAEVFVEGVKQESGVTSNDFSNPVTYTVIDKNGNERNYIVNLSYSGLPVLFIETPGNATIPDKHSDWLSGTKITLYNTDWSIAHKGTMGIRGRGNSTWQFPKKPYALKLDSKAEILGMPKHKRWVLLANWMDRTLLRNCVAFHIATKTGLDYTPRGQFVEVFINGEHNGNYYLCEHIKVDENRVNVDELDETKTDSGYIMELDVYYDEEFKFRSMNFGLPYMFKDPDEVTPEQIDFFQGYVNNLEASLVDEERFKAREYENYIDVESFIDWWFVQELAGNEECKYPKSSYMHKDKGGKLTMGPVWDFDWETFTPHTRFRIPDCMYYGRLFEDPEFKAITKARWNELKPKFETVLDFIASQASYIRNSEMINYMMWPIINYDINQDTRLSFDEAVAKMQTSYLDKLNWMDEAINEW